MCHSVSKILPLDTFRTLQRHLISVFDYVSKFYSVFFPTSVRNKLIFSGLWMKKWDQKVGHISKLISCTGRDDTGRSLFFYCTGRHYPGSLNHKFKDSFESSYEPYLVNWIPTALKWVVIKGNQEEKGSDHCFCYRPNDVLGYVMHSVPQDRIGVPYLHDDCHDL